MKGTLITVGLSDPLHAEMDLVLLLQNALKEEPMFTTTTVAA